ncbi:hypothetical protein BH20CHL6_BH20CHL6_02950 [soil metagenome]
MTARHQLRVGGRRLARGERSPIDATPAPSVGDVLYAARERKGVDLYRAERDTKIRAKYLDALERSEYAELPGAVYTKGFLRNYAVYLGLDPDEIVEHWRQDGLGVSRAPEKVTVEAPPRPIEAPRRLTFTPGLLVAALLTLGLVAFAVYVGFQLVRFSQAPPLEVTQPGVVSETTASGITMAGSAAPFAVITIKGPGEDEWQATADAEGIWSTDVSLIVGRNDFAISATDPARPLQPSDTRQVIVTVPVDDGEDGPSPLATAVSPSPSTSAPTTALRIVSPRAGARIENVAVEIAGTSDAEAVLVEATYEGPATPTLEEPSPEPSPEPPGTPEALELEVDDEGAFAGSFALPPGRWELTISAEADGAETASETRAVTVTINGVNLAIEVRNGPAWIRVVLDGEIADGFTAGRTLRPGERLEFTAEDEIVVRTGSAGTTFFTLNGRDLGALGRSGIPQTWSFGPEGEPTRVQ